MTIFILVIWPFGVMLWTLAVWGIIVAYKSIKEQ